MPCLSRLTPVKQKKGRLFVMHGMLLCMFYVVMYGYYACMCPYAHPCTHTRAHVLHLYKFDPMVIMGGGCKKLLFVCGNWPKSCFTGDVNNQGERKNAMVS